MRFPQIFSIVTDGITVEGLTLLIHGVVTTSASWGGGAIAGRRKLKIVWCEACLKPRSNLAEYFSDCLR